MDTQVKFLNCYMLDSDYNHTVHFTNRHNQLLWFNQYVLFENNEFDYQRKNNNIKVGYSLEELKLVNYLIISNDNGEKFFYFIMDKVYINEEVTELILQLDLIQTYQFDLDFKECLVEREHIQEYYTDSEGNVKIDYDVFYNIEEGLDTGEYLLYTSNNLYDYKKNGCYVYTSSERLGKSNEERVNISTDNSGGSSDSEGSSGSNFKLGYMDKNGLKFLKSIEKFSPTPYNIGDGTNTVGYGITEVHQPSYYAQLIPTCTEQKASEIMGEVCYNFSKQIYDNLKAEDYDFNNMTQGLFNAMTSFAYNSGIQGLKIQEIWTMILENKSLQEIAQRWTTTNTMPGSIYEEGLIKRRELESKMVLDSLNYDSIIIYNAVTSEPIKDNNGYGYIPKGYN